MSSERVWHYVKRADTVRIPRRHVFLDTESVSSKDRKNRRQTWRLGVAAFRQADKGRPVKDRLSTYVDPAELWTDVDRFTSGRNRTILWAHNLGYDVRISEAFSRLPAMGWTCQAHNLANRGTWLTWRKGDAALTMADSASIFPLSLEQVGKYFGVAKLPLPDDDDSNAAWEARCVRDVEILRTAIVQYLDWLERDQLGSWRLTGAGQSYAAFRHRFSTHPMLVHCDQDAMDAERRAMWTGRCEAYYRGRIGGKGIEEWDLSLAYGRIVQRVNLPTRLIGEIPADRALSYVGGKSRHSVLADVEIETSVPIAPTHVGGYMAWPVGRFETTLWGPELALAVSHGCQITVRRAWIYAASPALKEWADWIIDQLGADDDQVPAWQKSIYKHWIRALIGRFGMRYTEWEQFASTPDARLLNAAIYDVDTGDEYEVSHVGHTAFRSRGTVDWSQSQAAITGYVMAEARVWLWQLIQAMPPRSVYYCDTDSLYVDPKYHREAVALAASTLGEGLRLKATHQRARILGPRQVVIDGRPRVSGLPSNAVTMPDGTYTGEVWQSLSTALAHRCHAAVITRARTWQVSGVDHRRLPGPDGWTLPIEVRGGEIVDTAHAPTR